jgi:hypothetical protein
MLQLARLFAAEPTGISLDEIIFGDLCGMTRSQV